MRIRRTRGKPVNLSSAVREEAPNSLGVLGRARHTRLCGQFLLFCLVGVSNTVLDAAVFSVLVSVLGWREGIEPAVASMLGFVAGAANSYAWNSRLTFRSGRRRDAPQMRRFVLATGIGVVASGTVFALARELWPQTSSALVGAKGVALAASTVTNFVLQRSWVFRAQRSPVYRVPRHAGAWVRRHPLALILLLATG